MHTLSIEARLSCCFVFTALTIYLYRVGASSIHIGAAYRFLRGYERQIQLGNVLADPALKEILVPIVKRLFVDAATLSDALSNAGPITPYEDWKCDLLYVPPTFSTFEAAYEVLSNLLKYAIALSLGHFKAESQAYLFLQSSLKAFRITLEQSRYDT